MSVLASIRQWFDDLRGKPRELTYEESVQLQTEAARDGATLNNAHDAQLRSRARQAGF